MVFLLCKQRVTDTRLTSSNTPRAIIDVSRVKEVKILTNFKVLEKGVRI